MTAAAAPTVVRLTFANSNRTTTVTDEVLPVEEVALDDLAAYGDRLTAPSPLAIATIRQALADPDIHLLHDNRGTRKLSGYIERRLLAELEDCTPRLISLVNDWRETVTLIASVSEGRLTVRRAPDPHLLSVPDLVDVAQPGHRDALNTYRSLSPALRAKVDAVLEPWTPGASPPATSGTAAAVVIEYADGDVLLTAPGVVAISSSAAPRLDAASADRVSTAIREASTSGRVDDVEARALIASITIADEAPGPATAAVVTLPARSGLRTVALPVGAVEVVRISARALLTVDSTEHAAALEAAEQLAPALRRQVAQRLRPWHTVLDA